MQASVEPEVLQLDEFTRDEVRAIVLNETGRNLSYSQFYYWKQFCFVNKEKSLYSRRDVAKFLFVARTLNRQRSLKIAQKQLAVDIQKNPKNYPPEPKADRRSQPIDVNAARV